MKLVMFEKNGPARLGALKGEDTVVDLSRASQAMLADDGKAGSGSSAEPLPTGMAEFLEGGDRTMALAQRVLDRFDKASVTQVDGQPLAWPLSEVKLAAPIPNPQKIICVAHNYHDFLEELGMEPHPEPVLFAKFANAVASHDQPVIRPAMSQALGYEVELAFVVGKPAHFVSEEDAYDYIAGYMTFNDVSASDLTKRDVQNLRGKSFDTFAPMGPYLLTRDELPDPHDLHVELRVNGRVLQSSNTARLVHNVPQLLSFCSHVFSLVPGDVVATGTPGGLAKDRKPTTYMNPGDIMETEVEKLGIIRSPIVEEASAR